MMQINRTRGDTYADVFQILKEKTLDIVDISGCQFKLTLNRIKNPEDNSQQVYQLDGNISDSEQGLVEFAPDSNQADLTGLFYFDIQMIDSNGIVRTLVKDVYQYVQDITKN